IVRGVVVARQVDARRRDAEVDVGRTGHAATLPPRGGHVPGHFITSGVDATTASFSVTSLTVYGLPLVRPSSSLIEMSPDSTVVVGSTPSSRVSATNFLLSR